MDKIVAVRIDDTPDGPRVSGYVARQKNRRLVWSFYIGDLESQEVKDKVEELETIRLTPAAGQGGLA